MNPKPISINPTVTHRVQPMGFVKVAALSGLLATGAIALAYDPQTTEYTPQVVVPNVAPSSYVIQSLLLDSETSGSAVIELDSYILKVSFDFESHPDSYGVPGSEFTAFEITNLSIDDVKSIYGVSFNDFTDYNDHRNINQLIVGYIEKNRLVEAA